MVEGKRERSKRKVGGVEGRWVGPKEGGCGRNVERMSDMHEGRGRDAEVEEEGI